MDIATTNLRLPGLRTAKQSRSAKTQVRFLRSALELFAEHGYTHTTVKDIIHHAEQSIGAFYHHFRDKEGLFSALTCAIVANIKTRIEELDLSPDTAPDLQSMLHQVAVLALDIAKEFRGFYLATYELQLQLPNHQSTLTQATSPLVERINVPDAPWINEIGNMDKVPQMVSLIFSITTQQIVAPSPGIPEEEQHFLLLVKQIAKSVIS